MSYVCIVDMDDEELAEAVSCDSFRVRCMDVLTFDLCSSRCLSG